MRKCWNAVGEIHRSTLHGDYRARSKLGVNVPGGVGVSSMGFSNDTQYRCFRVARDTTWLLVTGNKFFPDFLSLQFPSCTTFSEIPRSSWEVTRCLHVGQCIWSVKREGTLHTYLVDNQPYTMDLPSIWILLVINLCSLVLIRMLLPIP